MRVILYSVLIFILTICFSFSLQADGGNIIFSVDDPAGDDCGPCYYNYPTNKIFSPFSGLYDIRNFSLIDDNENYIYEFHFTEITDPWNSRFGFSMPLIELYIDNDSGGSTKLFEEGANIRLDPEHPWNKLIKISGWWVRVFTPADKGKNMIDLSAETEEFPQNVENARVETKDNVIRVELGKELTGDLTGAKIYILVGSFDPFGFDHFRGLKQKKSSWSFSTDKEIYIDNAPRVVDIILPPGKEQSKVLEDFTEKNFCQVYPVKIKSGIQGMNLIRNDIVYLGLILLLMILIIFNKENIFKHINYRNIKNQK